MISKGESQSCLYCTGKYKAGNGFTIAAAHTDSPVLKVKPVSKVEKNGTLQVRCLLRVCMCVYVCVLCV